MGINMGTTTNINIHTGIDAKNPTFNQIEAHKNKQKTKHTCGYN